jgi:hypothetical protein
LSCVSRDRLRRSIAKLWLALVRHAWDDLDKPGHICQIPIADVIAPFER